MSKNIEVQKFKDCRMCHITIFPRNNELEFTQDVIDKYFKAQIDTDKVTYYIIQGEYTVDKRQHLQIYAQFKRSITLKAIKKAFDDETLHVQPITYGNVQDCIKYCTNEYRDKNGNAKDIWKSHIEFGTPKIQGSRTDISNHIQRIKDGEKINNMLLDDDTSFAKSYTQYFRTYREIETLVNQQTIDKEIIKDYEGVIWKPFQQDIINSLDDTSNKRKIRWIHENTGNIGKSYMTMYLSITRQTYVVTGGRKEDILYAYKNEPLVIFDLARDFKDKEYIYEVMELLSNGQYLSTKFQSVQKRFIKPKIIVFSNFPPDTSRLSADRWDILDLNEKIQVNTNEIKHSHSDSELFEDIDEETTRFTLPLSKKHYRIQVNS